MDALPALGLDRDGLAALRAGFRAAHGVELCAVDAEGGADPARTAFRQAVHEALRWGEPVVTPCPPDRLCLAVPLLLNARLLGGLVAVLDEAEAVPRRGGRDVRALCAALLALAERANLTNAALLAERRAAAAAEAERHRALRGAKARRPSALRQAWRGEEPELLAALRRGDEAGARAALNRVLTVVWHHAAGDLAAIKAALLELLVALDRAAADCGAEPRDLADETRQLAAIADEETLARWLARNLGLALAGVRAAARDPTATGLRRAMAMIEERCAEPLRRDQVARLAGLSPAHFSRAFRAAYGRSFREVLAACRVRRAGALIARGASAGAAAQAAGFTDQSYFTKVFRRHAGAAPLAWRRRQAGRTGY